MKTLKSSNIAVLILVMLLGVVAPAVAAGKTPTLQDHINSIAASYIKIHASLIGDNVKDVQKNAAGIVKSADAAIKLAKKDEKKNKDVLAAIDNASKAAKKLDDKDLKIKDARTRFQALSDAVIPLVKDFSDKDTAGKYTVFYCPMVKAYWLQDNNKLKNPYYAKDMRDCGNKIDYDKQCAKCKGKGDCKCGKKGKCDCKKKDGHSHSGHSH